MPTTAMTSEARSTPMVRMLPQAGRLAIRLGLSILRAASCLGPLQPNSEHASRSNKVNRHYKAGAQAPALLLAEIDFQTFTPARNESSNTVSSSFGSLIGGLQLKLLHSTATPFPSFTPGIFGMVSANAGGSICGTISPCGRCSTDLLKEKGRTAAAFNFSACSPLPPGSKRAQDHAIAYVRANRNVKECSFVLIVEARDHRVRDINGKAIVAEIGAGLISIQAGADCKRIVFQHSRH